MLYNRCLKEEMFGIFVVASHLHVPVIREAFDKLFKEDLYDHFLGEFSPHLAIIFHLPYPQLMVWLSPFAHQFH